MPSLVASCLVRDGAGEQAREEGEPARRCRDYGVGGAVCRPRKGERGVCAGDLGQAVGRSNATRRTRLKAGGMSARRLRGGSEAGAADGKDGG